MVVVGAEVDADAITEATVEAAVECREEVFLAVCDEDHGEVADAVEFVQQVFVVELIDFVEDDDVGWAVVVAEAFEEFVCGCGLAVDGGGFTNSVEDAVQGFEAGVVVPAVHGLRGDIHDGLAEPFDDELRDAGLPSAARPVQKHRVG